MLTDDQINPPSSDACSVNPAERRVFERKRLDVEVGFASDSNFYLGFAEDISEGGLFVATVVLQEIGTRVALCFALPGGEEITATGVVRWLRDPQHDHDDCRSGMGVEFEGLDEEHLTQIREFVSLREPIFFEH